MPPLPSIFAFGITHLPMLGWLAAAAVPVLIHLWSRRRYREMSWAAMEYLLAAVRRNRRRLRFEHWLLLLIRTLVVVLIVLAVAEPYTATSGFSFAPGGDRTHRVLVIDGSFSMAYTPTDRSRFDRAKELAGRIVEESPQGDGFSLVLMSAPPVIVVSQPALEPGEFLQEIHNLTLAHATADLPATLAKVEEILVAARRDHPRLIREEVYFLSDLGRVGWLPDFSNARAEREFHDRAERLAESAALVVIDLGQAGAENVAVTSVRTAASYAPLGRSVTVQAELKNFGRQNRDRQTVELLVDGRRVDSRQVDLPAGRPASASFSYRFEAPGDHALEVRAEGDHLTIDNRRWLALPVKQSIRVLLVNGRPSGERFEGATGYLEFALATQADDTAAARVRPEVVPESSLLELDLARYDCLFLCDVAQFTSNEARVLKAYLDSGGSLVVFLGDRVLADRYNRELGGGRAGAVRLLPARLGPIVDQTGKPEATDRLDPLDYRHPIVEAFRGSEKAGLLTTPVFKYFKLKLPDKSKAKVALASGSGDPLIVEEPIGRGRVVLVATSADATWTPMPMWPSYVPIVQEILAYAVGRQIQQRNVPVGRPLGGWLSGSAADVRLVMQTPDGRSEQLRLRGEGDYSGWSYSDTTASGIYTARFGPPLACNELFAVNVDTIESDLTKLTEEQLREDVLPGIPFLHQTTWKNPDEEPAARIGRGGTFSVWLLYAVLALLLAETYLARRFGHHDTKAEGGRRTTDNWTFAIWSPLPLGEG